jgi:hypothetical protein
MKLLKIAWRRGLQKASQQYIAFAHVPLLERVAKKSHSQ